MDLMDKMFAPPIRLTYCEPELDFTLSPDKFIDWLEEVDDEPITGNYAMDVCTMCEYACLWICRQVWEKKLSGELYVCDGYYNMSEHYWMSYKIDDKEYFIDLTLAQFKRDAPKLSIVEANKSIGENAYRNFSKQTVQQYIESFY